MPWTVRRSGNTYEVVQENNGRVVGTHTTRTSAERQRAALYASEADEKDKGEMPVRNTWMGQFMPRRN